MNWRWLIFDFIDPAFGLSRPERKKIFASALVSKGTKRRVFFGIMAGYLAAVFVSILPLFAMMWWNPGGGSILVLLIVTVITPLAMYLATLFGFYRAIAKPLRLAMQRHGHEYCHQCRQPLIGLGKDIEQCPECGASREPLTCQACGYDLTGLEGDPPSCPECGDNQKKFMDPSRWWWIRLRQIDPCFLYFPDSARRQIFSVAWRTSSGRFLIAILMIVAVVMALTLIYIPFSMEENSLPLGLVTFLGILSNFAIFAVWCFVAVSLHKTYGASCRRQYRELGYILCLKCGRLLQDLDEGSKICPDCNALRLPTPKENRREEGLPTCEELIAIVDSHDALIWILASNRKRIVIQIALLLTMVYGVSALVAWYANNAIGWTVYGFALLSMLVGLAGYHRKALRRLVHNDLHAKGHDLCRACGFWFSRLGEIPDRCPDCGTKREPLPESAPEEHDPLT